MGLRRGNEIFQEDYNKYNWRDCHFYQNMGIEKHKKGF